MYDPTNGVWVSEDPIGFEAGDDNLTRYVGNDPTNATDPSGLQELLDSKSTDAAFTDPSPYYDGTEEPDKATYPIAHIFVTTQLEPLTKDAALLTTSFTLSTWIKETNSVNKSVVSTLFRQSVKKGTEFLFSVLPEKADINGPTFQNLSGDPDEPPENIETGKANQKNSPSVSYEFTLKIPCSAKKDVSIIFAEKGIQPEMRPMSAVQVDFSVLTDLHLTQMGSSISEIEIKQVANPPKSDVRGMK